MEIGTGFPTQSCLTSTHGWIASGVVAYAFDATGATVTGLVDPKNAVTYHGTESIGLDRPASVFEHDVFADMNRASWDLHIETNLRAPLVLAQVFARRLPADREGLIVNLLDQRVLNPKPEFFTYALSKSALWDATRMMAQALAPRIRVNAIGPGPVLQSIHQDAADFAAEAQATLLQRPASPAQIGAALRYLIDATAVTGQMIAVDSGQHLS